jgi:hypothetical protein
MAQVLQQANNGTVASIYAGIQWLVDQKCDVVSLSLSWDGNHDEWAGPVQALMAQGAVAVAASGNSFGIVGSPPSDSPSNYPLDPARPDQGVLISVESIAEPGRSGRSTVNFDELFHLIGSF